VVTQGASKKTLKAQAQAAKAVAELRKKQGRMTGPDSYESHMDRAAKLELAALDEEGAEGGMYDAIREKYDADTQRGLLGGSSGSRGNASERRRAASRVRALERQIELTLANAGPSPDDILGKEGELSKLLDEWESAKAAQIRASGGDPDDIQAQLDDL